MNKKVIVTGLLVVFLTLLAWLLQQSTLPEEVSQVVAVADPTVNPIMEIKLSSNIKSLPVYEIHQQCKPLLKSIQKDQAGWRKKIDPFLKEYHAEYPSADIMEALVLLEGDFFAYRKRELLRVPDKNYMDRNGKLSAYFLNKIGLDLIDGVQLTLGEKHFKSLLEKPKKEREEELQETGLLIREVIEVITSGKFNNQQSIEIMALLVDINGYSHDVANYRADSLLDVIAELKNYELLEGYIELGGNISNKKFGANALERLLSQLKAKENPDTKRLINKLVAENLPIRVGYTDGFRGEEIQLGAFWKRTVREPEAFKKIVEELGLVLIDTPTRESLKEKTAVMEIYQKLLQDKRDNRSGSLQKLAESEIELCRDTKNSIYQLLSVKNDNDLLKNAKQLYGDDKASIVESLQSISPALVDCFLQLEHGFKRTSANASSDTRKAFRLIYQDKIYQGIQEFNSVDRDENERANFFWDIVSSRPAAAGALIESGIIPQHNDFFWAARLNANTYSIIADLGFSFEHASPNGESLAQYAAKNCNADLMEVLFQREQPYSHSPFGNDVLSRAIMTNRCRTEKQRIDLIQSVMKFKPKVQAYHQNNMAYLRLKDFSSYSSISKIFPQLAAAEETKPKGNSICY